MSNSEDAAQPPAVAASVVSEQSTGAGAGAAASKDTTAAAAATASDAAAVTTKPPAAKKRARKPSQENGSDGEHEGAAVGENDVDEAAKESPPKKRGRGSSKEDGESADPDAAGEHDVSAAQESAAAGTDAAVSADDATDKSKKRKAPASKKPAKSNDAAGTAAAGAGASTSTTADAGEETESEPERQPKKRAKPAKSPREKKSSAPKKKAATSKKAAAAAESSSDSEDEAQQEVLKRVEALAPEIKAKFGSIVWVRMVGFPYWPALITDPRYLPPRLQQSAMKDLETKYLVYFFSSKNFAPTLFKNIEAWDDTKNDYRAGFPVKDSKAPKRRAQLMEAIAEADKELLLPIDERVDGLLKPVVKEPKKKVEKVVKAAPASKAKGKNLKALTARKTSMVNVEDASADAKTEKREDNASTPADDTVDDTADEPSQESTEEEDVIARSLSKEEIKAKIASRKAPSKKKVAVDDGDAKAKASGASKKSGAAGSKAGGKATAVSSSTAGDEIDTKRKKEIELMVPRKSVKSADIREMAEEAAKTKLAGGAAAVKDRTKRDKGAYSVGDLGAFASKLTRCHAHESAKNNDQVIAMLNQLFGEKVVYRSDVERSGLAAIIALLRKSSNPTVAQTASALRKHLMGIIQHDIGGANGGDKSAAADAESSKSRKPKDSKAGDKLKDASVASATAPTVSTPAAKASNGVAKSKAPAKTAASKPADTKAFTSDTSAVATTPSDAVTAAKPSAVKVEPDASSSSNKTPTVAPVATAATAVVATAAAASAAAASANAIVDTMTADASLDANRKAFVEMLGHVLEANGTSQAKLAREIEELVFERHKESNDEYMKHARKITFGLRGNKALTERLLSGSLHSLELVYADDKFFESSTP